MLFHFPFVLSGAASKLCGSVFACVKILMTKLLRSVLAAAKMMVYLEPSSEKMAFEIATALDESLSGRSIQVCYHSFTPSLLTQTNHQRVHTLQVCTEVLEALRKGHLGNDHQKAAEAYRVACHKIFPYSLSFFPPGYQDNITTVSANGDMFTGEHSDLANEMWYLRTSSGALVHWPSPFPQSLGHDCCELPLPALHWSGSMEWAPDRRQTEPAQGEECISFLK